MSWRGQGGRRAKGRRGEQEQGLDNTAWLAELEQEADQADDDEDWASTLRGRRAGDPTPPPAAPPPPTPDPGWPPPEADYRLLGSDPEPDPSAAWDPAPPAPAPDPDWSAWRPRDPGGFDERSAAPDPESYRPRPAPPEPESYRSRPAASDPGPPYGLGSAPPADLGRDDLAAPPAGRADPPWQPGVSESTGGWQPAGPDTPTGAWRPAEPVEPVGREPDYPALFGELYRRSAAQQDPVWEAPPAAEPLPEAGPPDPPASAWPFEESTQSWEPSDRSFIWPSDELPTTPTEWEPAAPSWPEDPPRPAPAPPDQTQAWSPPEPSPWSAAPTSGNGVLPPPATAPPPADWAAAIPTDVPAARRAADPGASTHVWRPDEPADAEPAVPLGPATRPRGAVAEPAGADYPAPPRDRRTRPAGERERQARAWPRIVAIISWIVLVMVVCWFYVFPWLEGVLPENF